MSRNDGAQQEKLMPTDLPTIPPDDPKRNLTLAQPDNLPHIGLVGDTTPSP
jgi:hypothetical protein